SGNSLGRLFRHFNLIVDWGFRGSYGPDGWLAGLNPRVNVDEEEAKSGELRPYPIAAYTPNLPWLSGTNGASLYGSGTSAATPQVAAAAALWLENHRREFGPANGIPGARPKPWMTHCSSQRKETMTRIDLICISAPE